MMVTVRFEDLGSGQPVALTIAVLRPDMFRLVVQTPRPPLPRIGICGQFVRFLDACGGGLGALIRHAHRDGLGGRAATATLDPG